MKIVKKWFANSWSSRTVMLLCILFITSLSQSATLTINMGGTGKGVVYSRLANKCEQGPCTETFLNNTTVYLYPRSKARSVFSGWSSCSSRKGILCTVPMDRDQVVTAIFKSMSSAGTGRFIGISGGGEHAVALRSDGTVWAVGGNTDGQLGNGRTDNSVVTPAIVQQLDSVAAIAAGGRFSLALKEDGTVFAWGANISGQLGDGTGTNRYSPSDLFPVSVDPGVPLDNIVAISAGSNHSLAIRGDGTVWAWGSNLNDQLGGGTTESKSLYAVQVPTLTGVAEVAAGSNHSVSLTSDGEVKSWGAGNSGQLGNGEYTNSVSPVKASLPTLPDIVTASAITSKIDHSLAVINEGKVMGWGYNSTWQLGNNSNTHSSIPVNTQNLTGIKSLASAYDHSMALNDEGHIFTWGGDDRNQLGYDTPSNYWATPKKIDNLPLAEAIAAGNEFSLALMDGVIWAWGSNSGGQLGDGTLSDSVIPKITNFGEYRIKVIVPNLGIWYFNSMTGATAARQNFSTLLTDKGEFPENVILDTAITMNGSSNSNKNAFDDATVGPIVIRGSITVSSGSLLIASGGLQLI